MAQNISIMVMGLCSFALVALLLPDGFGMPIDEDGNLSDGLHYPPLKRQPPRHKKNGPSGDRPWGR